MVGFGTDTADRFTVIRPTVTCPIAHTIVDTLNGLLALASSEKIGRGKPRPFCATAAKRPNPKQQREQNDAGKSSDERQALPMMNSFSGPSIPAVECCGSSHRRLNLISFRHEKAHHYFRRADWRGSRGAWCGH
jgi:hypothetical protein